MGNSRYNWDCKGNYVVLGYENHGVNCFGEWGSSPFLVCLRMWKISSIGSSHVSMAQLCAI